MRRYLSIFAIAIVSGAATLLIASGTDSREAKPFLVVGNRYRCVVEGKDIELTVREVIDHQWIRAEMDDSTFRTPDGDRPFSILVNLSRVNAIVPLDPAEVRASLGPASGGPKAIPAAK